MTAFFQINRLLTRRITAAALVFVAAFGTPGLSLAEMVIDYNYTLTTSGKDTVFTMPDNIRIVSGGTISVVDAGGIHGGYITINIPNGYTFQIDNGGKLSADAVGLNGNGGSILFNPLGISSNLIVNAGGIISANGLGSGMGGRIDLKASNLLINGMVRAQSLGSGQGGIINLTDTDGLLNIGSTATITTNGLSSATQNLITIEAGGVAIDGQIVANGTGNGGGGTIRLIARNGQIKILSNGDLIAQGSGTGTGGTVELKAGSGSAAMDLDNCSASNCAGSGDTELVLVHDNARIKVGGGNANNGVIRIGRSTAGAIAIDMNDSINNNQITGAGTIVIGDRTANTASLSLSNYNSSANFNGSNPLVDLNANGNITANSGNNFTFVKAASNTGSINIADTTSGMTVTGLETGGASTLTALNAGFLQVQNANPTGATALQSNGNITASVNNNFGGTLNITGDGTGGNRASAVVIASENTLNIGQLKAISTNLKTTGAASDLNVAGVDLTGNAVLAAGRDVNAGAVSNNFGTTTTASGRNISLFDNAGSFLLYNIATGGDLNVNTASGVGLSLANVDVGGKADIQIGGGNANISGTTGNVFRGETKISTNNASGGNIYLTADFQGDTTIFGDIVSLTDTAGDLNIVRWNSGGSGASYVNAQSAGANVNFMADDFLVNGLGKVQISADKNITFGRIPANWLFDDTLVLNSRSGGDITLNNMKMGNFATRGSVSPYDVSNAVQGISMSTNGGRILLNNFDTQGTVNIESKGDITTTTGGNVFRNTVALDGGTTGNVNFTTGSNDFQSGTNNFTGKTIAVTDTAGNFTVSKAVTDGTLALEAKAAGASLQVSNANAKGTTSLVSAGTLTATDNTNFGLLTAKANGAMAITEDNDMTIQSVVNESNATTTLASNDGSILGKGNAETDVTTGTGNLQMTAGNTLLDFGSAVNVKVSAGGNVDAQARGRDTNGNSITLAGTVGGNVSAKNANSLGTTGNINLGEYAGGRNLTVSGTTTFNAGNADALGQGSYRGAVSGTAGRIGLEAVSGDFTSGGLTATSSTGWYGAADETMIVQTRNGDILGSGYATSGAGNMRLQAGTPDSLNAANNISVTNVNAAQNLSLFATGDSNGNGSGAAISVGGASSVAGHITASGLNAANNLAGANGAINLTMASGNLKTALAWSKQGNINLTASNGSILQDASVYNYNNKTVFADNGDVTLQALGGNGSYVNTGVNALGPNSDLVVKATGSTNGGVTGTSVQLVGHVGGDLTVSNSNAANGVIGNVYLGTGLGNIEDLNDVYTVQDVFGNTSVRAAGNLYMYGSFGLNGKTTAYAKTLSAFLDRWDFPVNLINATGSSGTTVSITNYMGSITGGNITTNTGSGSAADVYLQAGSVPSRDKTSYIDLTGVVTDRNLTAKAAGSTDGTASGNSITITGSTGGATTTTNTAGTGTPLGKVTTP